MIKLKVGGFEAEIELITEQAQETVQGIRGLLPIKTHFVHCKFAGYELMIPIPAAFEEENQVEKVQPGDVGYYVGNGILCIFYGEIFPFGPVNLIGRVTKGLDAVKKIGELVLKDGPQVITLTES